jgi:pimeloyl-ACP methyl ester carboxylesterase
MIRKKSNLQLLIVLLYGFLSTINLFCSGDLFNHGINVSGFWESGLGDSTKLSELFFYDIDQKEECLSGTVEIKDTSRVFTGNLIGRVVNDSVFFNVDMQHGSPDFMFDGKYFEEYGESFISGAFKFVSGEIRSGTLTKTKKEICIINPELHPDNPYKLEKYSPRFNIKSSTGSPVIFVHGMTANNLEWDKMLGKLDSNFFSRHEVWRFQYKWEVNIKESGMKMYDSVLAKDIKNPIIICHSMGGLVARAYVSAGGDLKKLVTLGTPHHGSPLTMFTHILCWANQPGVQDMVPKSDFLKKLNNNPTDLSNRGKYYTISGRIGGYFKVIPPAWVWNENFYAKVEKEGFFVMQFLGENSDGIVPLESALFLNGNTNHPLPVQKWIDHLNLAHPDKAEKIFDYISSL